MSKVSKNIRWISSTSSPRGMTFRRDAAVFFCRLTRASAEQKENEQRCQFSKNTFNRFFTRCTTMNSDISTGYRDWKSNCRIDTTFAKKGSHLFIRTVHSNGKLGRQRRTNFRPLETVALRLVCSASKDLRLQA